MGLFKECLSRLFREMFPARKALFSKGFPPKGAGGDYKGLTNGGAPRCVVSREISHMRGELAREG